MTGLMLNNNPPVTGCRNIVPMGGTTPPLLSHPNEDLVFSEGQHRAGTRAFQVHDHARAVLQPQIAAARRAETGLAGALRVSARKIGDAGELVDGAGSADFLKTATGARNSADHFKRVGPPLVFERAAAAPQASDEILGNRHIARGRHARDALRGWSI